VCKKQEDQVNKMVTNLRQVMIKSPRRMWFFEGVFIKKAERSCAESNKEKKVSTTAQLQRRGLPMSINMVCLIWQEDWVNLDWTCVGESIGELCGWRLR
jgi:hypothetical protein